MANLAAGRTDVPAVLRVNIGSHFREQPPLQLCSFQLPVADDAYIIQANPFPTKLQFGISAATVEWPTAPALERSLLAFLTDLGF
jgi:hypothetical protein